MAYQALYRKYRPASFDEVVGQHHIVRTLQNAIAKKRIAHAYLFCGPRGTGKTSIAKIFARTLNCTGENPPCMECENCLLSLNGSHPDIIEIDAASNNGVDEVRSLTEKVGYAPMEGKYKVYIIDEVHMMTPGAFNALLKTIEEPPAHVIFIFATTEPHKVLPTILSRCQRFDFGKVSQKDIEGRLKAICEKEEIQADEGAVQLIAHLADGGMRDALSILDQCAAYDQHNLTVEAVREIYGVLEPSQFAHLIDHLNPDEAGQAIEFLEGLESKGMDMKRFTADLISLLKDSFLFDMAPHSPLIQENRRGVIENSFHPLPYAKRLSLVNDLMEIYNKFAYASSVMDYLETIFLKAALWQAPVAVSANPGTIRSESDQREITHSSQTTLSNRPFRSQNSGQNTSLSQLFWSSDVSRETIQNGEKSKSEFRFSEDFLLSLLVGATKEQKSSDLNHMNTLSQYVHSLDFGKFAASLEGIKLFACGEDFLLVAASDEKKADLINDLQNQQGYEVFTQQWLGRPKQVFACTPEAIADLTKSFRQRSQEGTLPEAAVIELKISSHAPDLEVQEQLEKRFPDLIVKHD